MIMGAIFLALVFVFLMFITIVFLISKLVKEKIYPNFEPSISVIIPSYNEKENIANCLTSIINSNYPRDKIELIVVDDGSIDNTIQIVEEYRNVKIIKQKHLGKSEALNKGIKNSTHDFVLTVDADIILEKDALKEIIKPFSDNKVAATTGNSTVKNNNTLISIFQDIEYHYNNLIRNSFSSAFNSGIWFFGALACYRKNVLKEIGYFRKNTLTEDIDIDLRIKKAGYKTINAHKAWCSTVVPTNLRDLYKQRYRWWIGALQSLKSNFNLLSLNKNYKNPSILFLFINQFWWSIYSFIAIPLTAYQVNYWLPQTDVFGTISYFFRWFSLSGPFYVIYKIPEWGISMYNIFGVLAGIISTILIIFALLIFKRRITLKNIFAIFFYFPYTILLNVFIVISIVISIFSKKKYFID